MFDSFHNLLESTTNLIRDPDLLRSFKVVITTYNIVERECPLFFTRQSLSFSFFWTSVSFCVQLFYLDLVEESKDEFQTEMSLHTVKNRLLILCYCSFRHKRLHWIHLTIRGCQSQRWNFKSKTVLQLPKNTKERLAQKRSGSGNWNKKSRYLSFHTLSSVCRMTMSTEFLCRHEHFSESSHACFQSEFLEVCS